MSENKELTERLTIVTRIERSNVVDISEEDLDEFICKLCSTLLSEPLTTQCCRQIFCKQCVEKHVSEYNTCPEVVCKQLLCCESLIPASRPFVNLLGNLKVNCCHVNNGCTQVLRFKDLGQHIQDCEHRPKELCIKCGLIKDSLTDHDCIASLIIDRDQIINDLKREIELDQNKFQCEISKLTSEQKALQIQNNQLISEKNYLESEISKIKSELHCCKTKLSEEKIADFMNYNGTYNNPYRV